MSKIHFKDFLNIKKLRNKKIDDASKEIKEYKYIPNELAKIYHPKKQLVTITNIEQITSDIKRFTVKPLDNNISLAPMAAGEYICVKYTINNIITSRPYSLCSTFKQSLNNEYQFAIKLDNKGLTSPFAHNNLKINDILELSAPAGTFVYQPLRDSKHVVGIAGGVGITPFISFINSILEETEDFELTLFYGVRTINDIAFKSELDKANNSDKIKVIYVLSDDNTNNESIEHGFINSELIKKYVCDYSSCSYFACGPKAMYNFLNKELEKLNINKKHRRIEVQGEATNINNFDDHPSSLPEAVNITVHIWDETYTIKADPTKTILRNLEENGIAALNQCRSGECGYCHSSLVKGEVYMPKVMDHLRMADKLYNQIHLCCTYPISDIEIIIAKVN